MNNVSQLSANDERKEKRRLHLREVAQGEEPETTNAAGSVGATLRAARIARGEDTTSVAAALKMRVDQLEAIEDNDFSRLPGRTYAIGFVRAYGRYLDLDTEALIQKYKDESAGQDGTKPVELVFPKAVEDQKLPNGSILIVALIIAMVIYGVSYLTMPNRKTPAATAKADEAPVVVVQPAPVAPPPVKVHAEAVVPAAPAEVAAPPSPAATGVAATPVPANEPASIFVAGNPALPAAAAPAPTSQAMLDTPLLSSAAFAVGQQQKFFVPPSAQASAPAPEHVSGISNTGSRVTLRAVQPTYVRVRDMKQQGANAVLLDRVLSPGESFQPPDRAGLMMQTGNAGGLQVEVDGRIVGVLGRSGEVITRIPVDPSYFLERMAASR
jgi:cytoskeleton protein RodZ